jgi:hypothetical protein
MPKELLDLFQDEKLVERIQKRLPYLFQLAELESSRAGKTGMEVGSIRGKIIVALLIYKFGQSNVETDIPITEPEIDVKLFGKSLSIKTITGNTLSGVKLIWTVDAQKAREYQNSYYPSCDILLVQINWNGRGGFYYMPLTAQERIFNKIGRENYIKLPKLGTNPRGVEITREALLGLINDVSSNQILINWNRKDITINVYKRWLDLWKED